MLDMRRLAVFALIAVTGCSSGLDYAGFADALVDARCTYYTRCGLAAAGPECRAFFDRMAIESPSTQAALDAGTLAYHADTAQACLDAYAGLACDLTQQSPDDLATCYEVLTGTVALGDACAFDRECTSGRCDVPTCTDACCAGTCIEPAPRPAVGEPCTALCAGDAFCGVDSLCHAPLPEGAACDAEPCAYGLYCAGRTQTMAGACSPLPHLGEPCESACAEVGATCVAGSCVAVGLLDDPCTSSAECSMFYECVEAACALPPTLGMSCTTSCYEAAYCDGTSCVPQKPAGASCLRNDECDSHYCDRTANTGTCAELPLCI